MSQMGFKITNNQDKKEDISNLIHLNFTHSCIIGETGSGKTSSMVNPNLLNRLKLGHGVLVFDHKGNYHTTVKALAKRTDRLGDVVVIGMPWDKKCNIIEDMDESSFVEFLHYHLNHSAENKFWEQSAISMALTIFRVLESLEKLNRYEPFNPITNELSIRYSKSIKTIYKITVEKKLLKSFSQDLGNLLVTIEDKTALSALIADLINKVEDGDTEATKMINSYLIFENNFKTFKKEIIDSELANTSSSKTFDNILISLSGPLGALANVSYINKSEININDILNNGKIVVFLCNQLPSTALASITKSIFQNFNERIGLKNLKDVSIFIDEAQRVLNSDVDLPIDTLREARVDVCMAFQTKDLLIQKIGIIKTRALDANLTSRYYLKNQNQDDDMVCDKLEKFSFLTNLDGGLDIHKAKPIFIDDKELFDSEFEYQKMIDAKKRYRDFLPTRGKRYILKFIPSLYAKDTIIIEYKDKNIKHCGFLQEVKLSQYENLKEIIEENQEIGSEMEDNILYEIGLAIKAEMD